MDNVSIYVSVDDSAAEVVRSSNIIVDSVPLSFRIFLGVRSRTLLGKVNNRIGLFVFYQLD